MPKNQFEKLVFAFITVVITVHAYVFYSIYVVNGNLLMSVHNTTGVIEAVNKQGGIYMCGRYLPIFAVVLIEFVFAYCLEIFVGSPLSLKMAFKQVDPRKSSPMVFEAAIICSTVLIMCPAMSFIAAVLYYPYYNGFNAFTLLANWLKLVCFNFPFALISQLFFIQPIVRFIFGLAFGRNETAKKKKLVTEN